MTTHAHIRVENSEPIATIIIDRPAKRNAIDGPMARALTHAFKAFEEDESLRVAVLWGAGGAFSAGADLGALIDAERRHDIDPNGGRPGPMGPTRTFLQKPVIAAVAGPAISGGLELALLADLRVAEESATFGVFSRRWGVPLIDGGTVRLPRVVGMGRALDMILTGRAVSAREALDMGLANRVVANGTSRSEAEKLARQIAAFPQYCLLTDRASAYRQWFLPLSEALREEGRHGAPVVEVESFEGAKRFVAGAGRGGRFDD
ncbi:MAG: crotonase/enoyl-CoA hydratase family protein [Roseiarcus sp.]